MNKKLSMHHGRLVYQRVKSTIPRKPNNISIVQDIVLENIPAKKNDEVRAEELKEALALPTTDLETTLETLNISAGNIPKEQIVTAKVDAIEILGEKYQKISAEDLPLYISRKKKKKQSIE